MGGENSDLLGTVEVWNEGVGVDGDDNLANEGVNSRVEESDAQVGHDLLLGELAQQQEVLYDTGAREVSGCGDRAVPI